MVLLHYLVVPGLGDGNGTGSRSQATAVHADEAAPADRGDTAAAAAAAVPPSGASPVTEAPCAA